MVVAAQYYPDSPRKGDPIGGLEDAEALEGVHVVHAGTAVAPEGEHAGRIVSAGGRVLAEDTLAGLTRGGSLHQRFLELVGASDTGGEGLTWLG